MLSLIAPVLFLQDTVTAWLNPVIFPYITMGSFHGSLVRKLLKSVMLLLSASIASNSSVSLSVTSS